MTGKAAFQAAGWALAGLLGGYLLFERLHQQQTPAPAPSPMPTAAVLESFPTTTAPPTQSEIEEEMARSFLPPLLNRHRRQPSRPTISAWAYGGRRLLPCRRQTHMRNLNVSTGCNCHKQRPRLSPWRQPPSKNALT